jgi:hypothetical protein
MSLVHYIITRFSIFDPTFKGFVLTRNSSDVYTELFSRERMDFKFDVFERVTYPSIMNQTYQNYVWLIYASIRLPDEYKARLENILSENVQIIYVKNFEEFNIHRSNFLDKCTNYTTIRIDDDDGLSENFLEELNKYSGQSGKIITAPNGIKFTIRDNEIVFGEKYYSECLALGLTAIGFDIYGAGDHTAINEIFKIIVDDNMSYKLCCSDFCDTRREFS